MRIAAAILALASAGATLTASTATALAEESRQIIVQYSDLNLAAPAGRSTLDARIRSAARGVCGAIPSLQVAQVARARECHSTALAHAWDQITANAGTGQVRGAR